MSTQTGGDWKLLPKVMFSTLSLETLDCFGTGLCILVPESFWVPVLAWPPPLIICMILFSHEEVLPLQAPALIFFSAPLVLLNRFLSNLISCIPFFRSAQESVALERGLKVNLREAKPVIRDYAERMCSPTPSIQSWPNNSHFRVGISTLVKGPSVVCFTWTPLFQSSSCLL